MTNPPHLQLLHCLRSSSPGGASLFSDALRAAESLFHNDRSAFEGLATIPVTHHYRNAGHHYCYSRPTIELAEVSRSPVSGDMYPSSPNSSAPTVSNINYSPPFQAPFPNSSFALQTYHRLIKPFAEHIESPESLFEHRLSEGECVIFDNRRVLHARRAFDASVGERWLKGAYVDGDVFWSRWRVLTERRGVKE